MRKSNAEIAAGIVRRVHILIMQELPKPECPQKAAHNTWRIEQVKQAVAAELAPAGNGLNVTIDLHV